MTEDFFTRKQRQIGVSLNPVQKEAVLRTEGPLLLLATPGSGKTTTIMMRIGYLIEEKGVHPSRIKAVTFSKAAAANMKERFRRFFPEYPEGSVGFSTIHSLASQVMADYLRQRGIGYRVIERHADEPDAAYPALHKTRILREIHNSLTGESIAEDQLEALTTYISYVKNKRIPPDRWDETECDVKEAPSILREYEAFKKSGTDRLLVDYDDMLEIAYRALSEDRRLLAKYQRKYDYVLTDESQDTSLLQHEIIALLVQAHGNLCVVADDDQSIYGWRAAEPRYLLDFKQAYPDAVILKMEHNYRSTKHIVEAANAFIKRNRDRYDKNMTTGNPAGEPIRITSLPDYKHQARYVAERIMSASRIGDSAVLYRNHHSSVALVDTFDRLGIPFYMKDGDHRFFSHWVVEDVLNFMRMAYTDRRPDLLERIYQKFNAYITREQMEALKRIRNNESVFDNLLRHVELRDYQPKLLEECKATFASLREMSPKQAIWTIRANLGYEKALEKRCERLGFRRDTLIGILNTLEDIADGLETLEAFASRLKRLQAVMREAKFRKGEEAVTLSTLHSAKGLEFDRVYMIDLIEGVIPSAEDIKKFENGNRAPMEEAVRLFYVGMTRAKRELELLTYRMKDGQKTEESRLVSHIRRIRDSLAGPGRPTAAASVEGPKPVKRIVAGADQLQKGVRVRCRGFGDGEILDVDEEDIVLRLDTGIRRVPIRKCLEEGLLERIGPQA